MKSKRVKIKDSKKDINKKIQRITCKTYHFANQSQSEENELNDDDDDTQKLYKCCLRGNLEAQTHDAVQKLSDVLVLHQGRLVDGLFKGSCKNRRWFLNKKLELETFTVGSIKATLTQTFLFYMFLIFFLKTTFCVLYNRFCLEHLKFWFWF